MNKITEVTKRDIRDVFCGGFDVLELFETKKATYIYYGRLTEVDFLKKIYPIDTMPSTDSRFPNAGADIWQHTVNNDDWEPDWIFDDDRFGLLKGDDETFLNFICAVFHPENRYEQGYWINCLEKIKPLLRADGYEIYECDTISNRSVYSYREISEIEAKTGKFNPFSLRNNVDISSKKLRLKIPIIARKSILDVFNRYNDQIYQTDHTGWNYYSTPKDEVIKDIASYYTPKAYNSAKQYVEVDVIENFILGTSPYCIFDAIELYTIHNDKNYVVEINEALQNANIGYSLVDGKVDVIPGHIKTIDTPITEIGLKELICQAESYIRNSSVSDKQVAIEKLWDALERLKTYYTDRDKKASVSKIIDEMSGGDGNFAILFTKEFKELTTIGDDYRIRHHETSKIEIKDIKHLDYLYARCHALINLALKYIN